MDHHGLPVNHAGLSRHPTPEISQTAPVRRVLEDCPSFVIIIIIIITAAVIGIAPSRVYTY